MSPLNLEKRNVVHHKTRVSSYCASCHVFLGQHTSRDSFSLIIATSDDACRMSHFRRITRLSQQDLVVGTHINSRLNLVTIRTSSILSLFTVQILFIYATNAGDALGPQVILLAEKRIEVTGLSALSVRRTNWLYYSKSTCDCYLTLCWNTKQLTNVTNKYGTVQKPNSKLKVIVATARRG